MTTDGIPDTLPGAETAEGNGNGDYHFAIPEEAPGGISTVPATAEQAEILMKPIDGDAEVDILPQNGACYMPHVHIRNRLNQAFRPLGWGLFPMTLLGEDGTTMWREWALYINGRYVSQAYGSMGRSENNQDTNLADYNEGTKSNALQRMAKDIGIGAELWDKQWTNNWRENMAVRVWVDGKQRPQWRRVDAPRFYGEKGVTDDSPNRADYLEKWGSSSAPAQPTAQAYANAPANRSAARQPPPPQPPPPPQGSWQQSAAPAPPPGYAPEPPANPVPQPVAAPPPPPPPPPQPSSQQLPPPPPAPAGGDFEVVKACKVLKETAAYTVYGVTTTKRQYSFFKQDKKNPNFDGTKLYANCQWALANQAPIVTQFVQDGNYFNLLAIAKAPTAS